MHFSAPLVLRLSCSHGLLHFIASILGRPVGGVSLLVFRGVRARRVSDAIGAFVQTLPVSTLHIRTVHNLPVGKPSISVGRTYKIHTAFIIGELRVILAFQPSHTLGVLGHTFAP